MSEYETINVKFAKDGEDIKLVSIDDNKTSSIPANAPSLGKFADGTFNKNADDVKIEEAIKATKEQPSTEVVQNENSTPVSSQSQFENNKQPENPVVQNQREEKKMNKFIIVVSALMILNGNCLPVYFGHEMFDYQV